MWMLPLSKSEKQASGAQVGFHPLPFPHQPGSLMQCTSCPAIHNSTKSTHTPDHLMPMPLKPVSLHHISSEPRITKCQLTSFLSIPQLLKLNPTSPTQLMARPTEAVGPEFPSWQNVIAPTSCSVSVCLHTGSEGNFYNGNLTASLAC